VITTQRIAECFQLFWSTAVNPGNGTAVPIVSWPIILLNCTRSTRHTVSVEQHLSWSIIGVYRRRDPRSRDDTEARRDVLNKLFLPPHKYAIRCFTSKVLLFRFALGLYKTKTQIKYIYIYLYTIKTTFSKFYIFRRLCHCLSNCLFVYMPAASSIVQQFVINDYLIYLNLRKLWKTTIFHNFSKIWKKM